MKIYHEGSFKSVRNAAWGKKLRHFKNQCRHVLSRSVDILEENKINYSLGFGTLLGLYRDKDFIGHDTDVDILILGKESIKKLNKAIERGEFAKHDMFREKDGIAVSYKDIYCDLYPLEERVDCYKWLNYKLSYEQLPLSELEFCGQKIKIPKNPEKYLEARYGKKWRTPVEGVHAQF